LKNTAKKVLIFDLDETIVHTVSELEMKAVGKGEYKDQHEIKIIQKVEISNNSIGSKTREYE
jgi:FMN phosphatase YigB (HAD superfamily)